MPKTDYYEMLINLGLKATLASDMLNRILNEFDFNDMKYLMFEMQEIEKEADTIVHDLNKSLINQYILPIRREDIFDIAESIDSIIDSLETIAQSFYMFAIRELRHEAKLFANIIAECVETINQMLNKFKKAKKLTDLQEYFDKLNYLEDKADKIYITSTKDLFAAENDPIILTQWEEIIFQMEKCCDNCNFTSTTISRAFLNNN